MCVFRRFYLYKFEAKKLKVEDPNCRVFEQLVQYEWFPEYCTKCMQVGHKCNAKEGPRPKTAPKLVSKWLQKQEATTGMPQLVTEPTDGSEEKLNDDVGRWQQVTPKTTARGTPGAQNKVQRVKMTNGFEPLAMPEQGTTSVSRDQGGGGEGSGGNNIPEIKT